MKVYESVTIDMNTHEIIDEISYDYEGAISECKGGGGDSESDTTTKPPSWLRQYMPMLASRAWKRSQIPMTYYPGSTVADFSPYQLSAQGRTVQRATQGSPLLGQAQGYTTDVLSGKYLNPETNPYIKNLMQTGIEEVMPGLDTEAMQSGRYGSEAWGTMKGKALSDIVSNIYNPERAAMESAAQYAPQLAREDYYDIGQLAGVGEEQQAMEQARINEQIARHEFKQTDPWQRMGMFANLLSGDWGGISTTKTSTSGGGK